MSQSWAGSSSGLELANAWRLLGIVRVFDCRLSICGHSLMFTDWLFNRIRLDSRWLALVQWCSGLVSLSLCLPFILFLNLRMYCSGGPNARRNL